jgi:hypothetical protein
MRNWDLRAGGRQALTSPMSEDEEKEEYFRRTFAFSRMPKPGYEDAVRRDAQTSQDVRLGAATNAGRHRYTAFLILYVDSPGTGYGKAHRLLGTQVALEIKKGPRGLKTI